MELSLFSLCCSALVVVHIANATNGMVSDFLLRRSILRKILKGFDQCVAKSALTNQHTMLMKTHTHTRARKNLLKCIRDYCMDMRDDNDANIMIWQIRAELIWPVQQQQRKHGTKTE